MEVDGATIEVVLAKPVDKKSPKKPSKPEVRHDFRIHFCVVEIPAG